MGNTRGMSLHIGINVLDKKGYPLKPAIPDYPDGWDGHHESSEYDAEEPRAQAREQGNDAKLLLSQDATSENVRKEIRRAAKELKSGDIFYLTYAGHGGQVPDRSRDEKDDRLDETWCLHDRQFLDDELFALYSEFEPGVRILIMSDSCHSGTVSRGGPLRPKKRSRTARCMPPESVRPIYVARRKEYDRIQDETPQVKEDEVQASILLLAACQDEQEADGNAFHGFFTQAVLDTWDNGKFEGGYDDFFAAVQQELDRVGRSASKARAAAGETVDESEFQVPNRFRIGSKDATFDKQRPFEI